MTHNSVGSEINDMTTETVQNRRFYDKEPTVSLAINTVLTFPKIFQGAVAKGISLVAIKDFHANDKMSHLKSLGKDVILPLYKSKQKKRFYDSNPDIHNALNYLRVLSPEERIITSTKLLEISHYLEHYLNVCESSTFEPQMEKLQNIRDLYVMRGEGDVKQYTDTVCMDLLKRMSAPDDEGKANAKVQVEISSDGKIVRFDHKQ